MLNFNVLKKDMGIVSRPHFVYDFSKEMFLMLYSNNGTNFIVRLPLLLEIMDNMYCIYCNCLFARLRRHKLRN